MNRRLPAEVDALRQRGVLAALDVHFARTVSGLVDESRPDVWVAAALASRAPRYGHICVDLAQVDQTVRVEGEDGPPPRWPEAEPWLAMLANSSLVRAADEPGCSPLVLDGSRLYLDRYWGYQRRLVDELRDRASRRRDEVDEALLAEGLKRLFGPRESLGGAVDQADAAALAVRRSLSVVSGGPGTGKTTTVKRILALVLEQAHAGREPFPPRIELLAPTGKAAARLGESVQEGLDTLNICDTALLQHMPRSAATIHRRLGFDPRHATRFRHGRDFPLAADVVVVDEASMVDLALMTKLLEAVPTHARLVLVGDRDQLKSVEAGAILGDICSPEATSGALEGCVAELRHTFRFGPDNGIGSLARAVRAGDGGRALSYLRGERTESSEGESYDDIAFHELLAGDGRLAKLRKLVVDGYGPLVQAARAGDPTGALGAAGRFRLLTAHRRGPRGVAELNRLAERWLEEAHGLQPTAGHYAGRLVMVTENDYDQGLFNGDVGVIACLSHRHSAATAAARASSGAARSTLLQRDPATPPHRLGRNPSNRHEHRPPRDEPGENDRRACEGDSELAVWFPGPEGQPRSYAPGRLPRHETVFAMTIHKSQGSEFDDSVVVLPEQPSPILTRELLYTGITRSRRSVHIAGDEVVLRHAVTERVQRASGLRAQLSREVS